MNNIKTIFTIKDLENISGVKAHTIRIWEKRYELLNPERSETNIRSYSHESLRKLLNVVLLNENGYKISKIAEMTDSDVVVKAREIALKSSEEEAVNSFKLSLFGFDKELFNSTYNKLLYKKTFREIFKDVLIPFLSQVGMLWQTKTILPAHEHFISNLIIQKIQINIEKLEQTEINKDVTYVLFLPENEIHEIGLLYLNYELILRGFKTIYLGQSLPLDNLSCFFDNESSICFLTGLTVQPYSDRVEEYFNTIDDILQNTNHKLIAFGRKTEQLINRPFKSNIQLYPSLIRFLEAI